MKLKSPVLQNYGFSSRLFLFILSISIFVLSVTASAETQNPSSETDSVGAQTAVSEPDSAMVDSITNAEQSATAEVQKPKRKVDKYSHYRDDIKRGERFFRGLLPHNNKQASCTSCHNLLPSDTLNWNPSAMEIAIKYLDKDFASFQALVTEPSGGKMAEVHQGYEFEAADLKTVKAYLDDLAMRGPQPVKPTINRLLLFLFLGMIITWALLELIFFHKIKYKAIPLLIFLGVFGYQVKMIYEEGVNLGRSQGYEPDQPIKFSHKVHAGQNQIDCKYCHFTVEDSKSAGIPPADLCLNCHSVVREGTRSGKFEIAKVIDAVENNKPVEWVRIHDLPDHVFFSHAQHVNSGKLDCIECHGDVAEMDVLKQVEDLSMGWCLDCHRTKEVQFVDNKFYESYETLHEQLKSGEINKVTVDMIGGTDCMKCHY
ncbi:cytochrome c3 family protein [uncultured Sunxiuqinia sp.]|uniref:cytochrome c3 family protein n=1 Tax=Sunxiuqinia rutila TaxID=1397841 RepID=UPI00261D63B1|nr:cytochrome c3 family protein [uncultured Sunxiuqinia sp.]